ncbi:MAG: NrtA/SsuA/CpmA family ABC transporter substrate-binding protein [Patescibacteria group bacterium]
MIKKIIFVLIVIAVAVGGYFLYQSYLKPVPKYSGPVEKITLAAYAGGYGFLPFIAEDQGYFKENGLDVIIKEYDFGKTACDDMLAGKVDIGTCADFVVTSYSFDVLDVKVLASIAKSNTDYIVARVDKGINQPSDLKGKKVGFAPKTKAEYFLGKWLTSNSLDYKEIVPVKLTPKEIVEAISKGDIDAASIWQPYPYEIQKRLGAQVKLWSGQSGQEFYCLLVSRGEWLKQHPEATQRFLKAMIRAEEYVDRNPEAVKNFIARRFNYDTALVESLWSQNKLVVSLPHELLLAMTDGSHWRINNNLTADKTTVPNYLHFIYFDALEAVKPEAVTIIRLKR